MEHTVTPELSTKYLAALLVLHTLQTEHDVFCQPQAWGLNWQTRNDEYHEGKRAKLFYYRPYEATNLKKKKTNAPHHAKPSTLSNKPPCPGIRLPASFNPASLFMTLSNKSPTSEPTNTKNPKMTATTGLLGHAKTFQKRRATDEVQSNPPRAPSTVFLGLIRCSLILPKALPKK